MKEKKKERQRERKKERNKERKTERQKYRKITDHRRKREEIVCLLVCCAVEQ